MAIRTFIALEIPESVRDRIAALQGVLCKQKERISWAKPGNIHLTLKFLGDISEPQIEPIAASLESALADFEEFEFEVCGLGAFPNLRRARVLWLGIVNAEHEFARLAKKIEAELIHFGFSKENRKFTPHLTLGRVKSPLSETFITAYTGIDFAGGKVAAREVVVMRSDLQPTGAVYTPLKRIKLANDKGGMTNE